MGNISPGEPLHIIDSGVDWIDEWYCVQEYAITLYGVDKKEVIPHIEKQEFIQTICGYAKSFRERIRTCKESSYSQAYAILTLCRALYTLKMEEQISKPAAARWAMEFLPEHCDVISDALTWRQERDVSLRDPHETYVLAQRFVEDVLERFFELDRSIKDESEKTVMMEIRYMQMSDKEFWYSLDKHLHEEEFQNKVRDKRGYVLLEDDKPIGLLRYNLFWDNTPFCTLLFVDWDYHGKGYGRSLMEHWEKDMKAKGYGMLLTSTQVDEEAQHFYRKLGYKDCGGFVVDIPGYEQPMEMFLVKGI